MKKVLITGSAGFIGSHLTELLLQRKDLIVIGCDIKNTEFNDNLIKIYPHYRFKNCLFEVLDNALIKSLDVIIHLAAKVSVLDSLFDPSSTLETNIKGTQELLYKAYENDIKFIFASSAAIFKESRTLQEGLTENSVVSPVSPYGLSKSYIESLGVMFSVNIKKS